jgi:hypothetical protein
MVGCVAKPLEPPYEKAQYKVARYQLLRLGIGCTSA